MPRIVRPSLVPLVVVLAGSAAGGVAAAGIDSVSDYGTHPVLHAGSRQEAGIERVAIVRERGAFTSRALDAEGAEVAVLRVQWPGDGTAQIEMTAAGGRWAGVWREAHRRLEIEDLESGGRGAGRWTDPGWELVAAPEGEEERWRQLLARMGWAFAETDVALDLAPWR